MKNRMVGIAALGLCLAATVAWWGLTRASGYIREGSGSAIEVERDISLGEQELGATIEPSFVVRNAGERPLILEDASSRCSCLGVFVQLAEGGRKKVERLEVQPGVSETLSLRFVVNGFPGIPQARRFPFQTNDPANPTVEIVVSMIPVARYFATPAEVGLGSVPVGEQVVCDIQLFACGPDLAPIARVVSSNERVRAEYHPGKKSAEVTSELKDVKRIGQVRVSFQAPEAPGEVAGEVTVFCKGRDDPVLKLRLTGRVVSLVELTPTTLSLPRASGSGPLYAATSLCRAAPSKSLGLVVRETPPGVVARVEDVSGNPSLKAVHLDASGLRDKVPATAKEMEVGLTATIDGRKYPLTLKLVVSRP